MTSWNQVPDSFRMVLDVLVELGMQLSSFQVQLLINFGGEARHEWLQLSTEQVKSLCGNVDDLLTSLFVAFEENPWSSRLPVSIAST